MGLPIEEDRQAHEADMKRRCQFFHAHMECMREKCGSKEGNSIPYLHKGKTWES
jgi:hypothetical protein